MFSCEFCEVFKNTFFINLWATASACLMLPRQILISAEKYSENAYFETSKYFETLLFCKFSQISRWNNIDEPF